MGFRQSGTMAVSGMLKPALLDAELLAQLADPDQSRLIVGYSGGVDSHVLLAHLCELGLRHKLLAFHVNHGLSPHANAWQIHCQKICQDLGVRFATVTLAVERVGNLEGNARDARYQAFAQVLEQGDLLLLGQHQDDQVETALFQLFRGSGRFGLQGMPLNRPIGTASLLRPLLHVSRARITAYAQQHHLSWIEDESNLDQKMTRNYLRQQVIPELENRWPDLKATLMASLQRDAEVGRLLDDVAKSDQQALRDAFGGILVDGFSKLTSARQKNLLLAWLGQHQLPYPSAGLLDAGLAMLLAAGPLAMPEMRWQGGLIRRFRDSLYLLRELSAFEPQTLVFDGVAPRACQGGVLVWSQTRGRGLPVSDPRRLEIRGRQGGESFSLGRTRSLKKWLQEHHVPPWLRDRLPLIYLEDELVAVAGLPGWQIPGLTSSRYEATGDQLGWIFDFEVDDRYI